MHIARKLPKPAEFRKAQKEVASLLNNYVGDLDFWPKMIKKRVQALKKIFNEDFEGEVSKNTLVYVEKIKKDISDVSNSFKDIHELLGEMIEEHGGPEEKKQFLGTMDMNDLSGVVEADWSSKSWLEEGWRESEDMIPTWKSQFEKVAAKISAPKLADLTDKQKKEFKQALSRTWSAIGYDVLQANDGQDMKRDEVIEIVLDADHVSSYGDIRDPVVKAFLKDGDLKEIEQLAKEEFRQSLYGM